MRFGTLLLLCSAALCCLPVARATEMPVGFFHGKMLSIEGSATEGVLMAAAANGDVFDCHYDRKTFVEVQKWPVKVDKLVEGDALEALAERRLIDRESGERTCFLLRVAVKEPAKPQRAKRSSDVRSSSTVSYPPPPEPQPRVELRPTIGLRPARRRMGSENIAGVVIERTETTMTLRTREGLEMFQLRDDTRFLGDGLRMDPEDVAINQHVSIEASRDLDGNWEAFQVVWGGLSVR